MIDKAHLKICMPPSEEPMPKVRHNTLPTVPPPEGGDPATQISEYEKCLQYGLGAKQGSPFMLATAIALATVDFVAGQRKHTREMREIVVRQIVDSMLQEADKILVAGVLRGVGKILGGVLTGVGGGLQMAGGFSSALNATKGGGQLNETQMARVRARQDRYSGGGQIANGVGGIVSGVFDTAAACIDADIKRLQADQKRMDNTLQTLKELQSDLRQWQQQVLDLIRQATQSDNQVNTKILARG